jgi:hypothetical protein
VRVIQESLDLEIRKAVPKAVAEHFEAVVIPRDLADFLTEYPRFG